MQSDLRTFLLRFFPEHYDHPVKFKISEVQATMSGLIFHS